MNRPLVQKSRLHLDRGLNVWHECSIHVDFSSLEENLFTDLILFGALLANVNIAKCSRIEYFSLSTHQTKWFCFLFVAKILAEHL